MGKNTAFFAYRSLARFAEIMPASAVKPISRLAGSLGMTLAPKRRVVVEQNLRHVVGGIPSLPVVRSAFASYCRYWLEALRLPIVPRDRLETLIDAEGFEHIDAARNAGKGVILALPHVGNWDAAGAWLVAKGIPLTVVAEVVEPPKLFTWFSDFRTSLGLSVVANGPDVSAKLLSALGDNEAIALLCDRDVDGTGGDYEFFGETTKVPKGPALLALRSGAPLLPVAVYEAGAGYRAVIKSPVVAVREGRLSDDVDKVTNALIAELEELIKAAPEQWHVFQPNWPAKAD